MLLSKRGLKKIFTQIAGSVLPENQPDFLIVGAQKAGTTSLYYYLNQHPNIQGASVKEINFFDKNENFEKGTNWYHKYFLQKGFSKNNQTLHFEATPNYLFQSETPKRIYDYNPGIKLIILLRDPVSRAFSSWNMYRDFSDTKLPNSFYKSYVQGRENNLYKELYSTGVFPDFDTCVASEMKKIEENSQLREPSFIRRGIYSPQIEAYLKLFPKEQLLILGAKDLAKEKTLTLNKVLSFLEIESNSWDFLGNEIKNKKKYISKISPDTQARLEQFYQPYNEKLYDLLGYQVNW